MPRIIFIGVLAAASLGATSTYNVTISTPSDASGTITEDVGYLEWDFITGGGPQVNVVGIEDFTSDGTLGDVSTQLITEESPGYVFGTTASPVFIGPTSAAVMIVDPVNSPFDAYAIEFTFGTTISFTLNATQNAPGPSSSPDELSFFLYESDDMTPLIATSDPSGSDSLLDLDIDGSTNGVPLVYSATDGSGVTATMTPSGGTSVPEPSTWPVLAILALLLRCTSIGRALRRIL